MARKVTRDELALMIEELAAVPGLQAVDDRMDFISGGFR